MARILKFPLLGAWIASALSLPAMAIQLTPPETPAETVLESYHGTFVSDPYRWLEDTGTPSVRAWFDAQNTFARETLAALPGRAALHARLTELNGADTRVYDVRYGGDRLFYMKRGPTDDQFKLYWRQGTGGDERLLVDPEQLGRPGAPAAIVMMAPSPNGKRLAYGVSIGGSEDTTLHVLDVDSGRAVGAPIPRADLSELSWRFDSAALYFNQLRERRDGDDPTEKMRDSRAIARTFTAESVVDRAVFGRDLAPAITVSRDDIPNIRVSAVSSYAIAIVKHGDANELTLYAAPLMMLKDASTPWRKVVDRTQGVVNFDLRGEYLYLMTSENAPRYQVVRWRLGAPAEYRLAQAEVVLPPGERIVRELHVAKDALYVGESEAGYSKLRRLEFNVKTAPRAAPKSGKTARAKAGPASLPKTAGVARGTDVVLPLAGTIHEIAVDPVRPGALLRMSGWTQSPALYAVDGKSGAVSRTALIPPSRADFSRIAASLVRVKSHDGVDVPLSIVYAKDAPRDGRAPLLLTAYGAYGISLEPGFRPSQLAFLERGGVIAIAHVRGGGELGKDWHLGGQKGTKPNTWRDLIACAEYLVRERWTSPERLAISGGSAGGITVGNALVDRPDLFRAVVAEVGIHDALRAELTANGPPNIEEFGSVETPEGFSALLAMSSYHRVDDGVVYPATLITTGYNDPRVEPWEPGKMAARLQAASASVGARGRPVLLRVDFDAGHGIGNTRRQVVDEVTDVYSFVLWQLGDPAFQP